MIQLCYGLEILTVVLYGQDKAFQKNFFLMTSYFHNGAPIAKKLILTVLARCTASGLGNIENLTAYCRKRILLVSEYRNRIKISSHHQEI